MWRVTYCLFGLPYTSKIYYCLQDCLDEVQRQWRFAGIGAMLWFKIDEKYEGEWRQRGFIKMDR